MPELGGLDAAYLHIDGADPRPGAVHRAVASSKGARHGGPSATRTRGRPVAPTLTIMADLVP